MGVWTSSVISRSEAIDKAAQALLFPWGVSCVNLKLAHLAADIKKKYRLARAIKACADHPAFDRSLRDGYAVSAALTAGASPSSPAYLKQGEQAAEVFTGGPIEEGFDAVVMLEDTAMAADWLEVRASLQSGENIVRRAEEYKEGSELLKCGHLLTPADIGLLASFGVTDVECAATCSIKAAVISTGDEIVPIEQKNIPIGKVRDVNGWFLTSLLASYGLDASYRGIVNDDKKALEAALYEALEGCDVVILSGGSSVSVRDFSAEILSKLPSPGLLVQGINVQPGKPTLIAGCKEEKKLVLGMPGHPLSCAVVAHTVLLPLLDKMCFEYEENNKNKIMLPLARALHCKAGVEEFFPAVLTAEGLLPKVASSGYVGVLSGSDGLIRMGADRETAQKGEMAEFIAF